WAYARREAVEIMRDPVRIAFALFNPIILMFAIGYGISFDVEHLRWAVFDQDRSLESRQFLDSFQNPKYFDRKPDRATADQIVSGLRSGELKFAVEVPTNFGHDLITQQTPEIGAWISGDMPFRAETTRSYLGGVLQSYLADLSARLTGKPSSFSLINIEQRYRYNETFKSIYSEVPSTIMVILILIPAIMTALGVVREVETGSIANFRSTPVTRLEFLLGKQLPYVLIGVLSFATLVLLAIFVFGVPVTGSWAAACSACARRPGLAFWFRPLFARRWPRCSARPASRSFQPSASPACSFRSRLFRAPGASSATAFRRPTSSRSASAPSPRGSGSPSSGSTTWRSRSSPSSSSAWRRSCSGNRSPERAQEAAPH